MNGELVDCTCQKKEGDNDGEPKVGTNTCNTSQCFKLEASLLPSFVVVAVVVFLFLARNIFRFNLCMCNFCFIGRWSFEGWAAFDACFVVIFGAIDGALRCSLMMHPQMNAYHQWFQAMSCSWFVAMLSLAVRSLQSLVRAQVARYFWLQLAVS